MIKPISITRFVCDGYLKVHGKVRECGSHLELSGTREDINSKFLQSGWTTRNFVNAKETPALSTTFHLCDWHDIHVDPTTGERLFK